MMTRKAGQPTDHDDEDDGAGDDHSDVYMSRVRRTNDVRTSKSDVCCESE